ncbi:MAG: fibronectin type III domain-containing protein, partial [Candidatus Staskawiczbacteria bacterium]
YVYYSLSPTLINPLPAGRAETTNNHIVSIENLSANKTYYFYVKSGAGENKNVISGEINYYNFITTSDSTPPVISLNQETGIIKTDNSIKILWTTSESSSSILEYGYGETEQYGTILHNDNYNTNHIYELNNLTKGTTYYIKIKNTDINNNSSNYTQFIVATTDSTDYLPPTISDVTASPIYDTSAIINWKTNEPTTTILEYGTSYGVYTNSISIDSLNIAHSKTLQNLEIKTKYYYRITSKDSNNNSKSGYGYGYEFTTLDKLTPEDEIKIREEAARAAGVQNGQQNAGSVTTTIVIDKTDKISPIISSLDIQDNGYGSLTFSWKTNEQTDSIIEYGIADSVYTSASVDLKLNIDHQIIINNLAQDSIYYYKITSTDSSGNRSISIIDSINTKGSKSSLDELLNENNITPNSEVQAVNDNKFLDMLQKTVDFIKDAAKNVSMPILEASLIEQQKSLQELSTLTPTPQIIGNPSIQTWEDMAVISWETDKKTSSLVAYSEQGVPLTDTTRAQTIGDPENLYLSHQVVLGGLKPETVYNYALKGKSALGVMTDFPASKFTTKEKAAKVDNYNINYLDEYSTSFKWSTSLPTDSIVRITPYRGNELSQGEEKIIKNSLVSSFHDVTIEDLEPGVFYKVDLYGYDAEGRILSQSIETFSSTSKEIPLLVDQVNTDSALTVGEGMQVQAIVSWNTTRPSTSKIYYRKKTNLNDDIWSNETTQDKNYTRKHLVVITDFDPGEVYQFQVESIDSNGTNVRSKTYTILTPRQKESVFQMILKNIEQTFGWVGTMNK